MQTTMKEASFSPKVEKRKGVGSESEIKDEEERLQSLLDEGKVWRIVNDLESYKNISCMKIAEKIINAGHTEQFARHINSFFKISDPSDCVKIFEKIIEAGDDEILKDLMRDNLYFEHFLNLDLQGVILKFIEAGKGEVAIRHYANRIDSDTFLDLLEAGHGKNVMPLLGDLRGIDYSKVAEPLADALKTELGMTITSDYFKDWNELNIEGNPELKDQLMRNSIRAERKHDFNVYLKVIAEQFNISIDELKEKLQKKVENMVEQSEFFVATPVNVLKEIMSGDGRWKSQFETAEDDFEYSWYNSIEDKIAKQEYYRDRDPDERDGRCPLYTEYRAIDEMKMFGFNKISDLAKIKSIEEEYRPVKELENDLSNIITNNKEKRPIYGYFSDEKNGAINKEGAIPPPTNVLQYGPINVKIKKERALKKATVTFQDSLDHSDEFPPSPAAKPHFTSTSLIYAYNVCRVGDQEGVDKVDLDNRKTKTSVQRYGYTEAQYHGGLTMDDVESIHISPHNTLDAEEIEEIKEAVNAYNTQNPESSVSLVIF